MSAEVVAIIAQNSKKKQKKKVSTLKKKILGERFKYFQSQSSSEEYENLITLTEKTVQNKIANHDSVSLVFNNLLNLSDCDDSDEMEEIYDNLVDIIKPFIENNIEENERKIEKFVEEVMQIDPSKETLIAEKQNKGNLDKYLNNNSNYIPLMVRFDFSIQSSTYDSIASTLSGIVFGGINLSVTTNTTNKLINDINEAATTTNTNSDVITIHGPPDIDSMLKDKNIEGENWIVISRGTIEDKDLEDESEAFEILFDLMNLSKHYGCNPNALWVETNSTEGSIVTNMDIKTPNNRNKIQLGIEFSNLDYGLNISQSLIGKQFRVCLCDQQGRTDDSNEESKKENFRLAIQIFDLVDTDMDLDEVDECIGDLYGIINNNSNVMKMNMKLLLVDKKHLLIVSTSFNDICETYRILNAMKFGGKCLELELLGAYIPLEEIQDNDELASAVHVRSNEITGKLVYTNNKDLNLRFTILVTASTSVVGDLNALKDEFMRVYQSLCMNVERNSGYILRCFSPLVIDNCHNYTDLTVVKFLYTNYQDAITMLLYLDGCVLGGTTVHCHLNRFCLTNSDPILESMKGQMSNSPFSIVIDRKLNQNENTEVQQHTHPKIPKLPKMTQENTENEGKIDLLSGLPHATEELALVVKEMLRDLARFQLNALMRDAVKAKAKTRYVIGLKQAINGVKSGRARLVILAVDCEVSETLASKFNTLVRECENKEDPIPIMYALKRRALGKALNTNTKVSAVAIYDPDGAYPAFKRIIRFLEID